MELVALLPMKLRSQRVPGKNFREFNGQPLFKYILSTLLEVSRIEKIIINTDARDELNKMVYLRVSELLFVIVPIISEDMMFR